MDSKQNRQQAIRMEFTEEQRRKIQKATGKNAQAIELSAQELEERIAPIARSGR